MSRFHCAFAVAAIAISPLQTAVAQDTPRAPSAAALPSSLSDSAFWAISFGFSEPGGHFQSENWTSNEGQYPLIVARLIELGKKGGAYIGVGPEQNFHYLAAIRPQIVFQLDIRRQMIMQHLMYKAVFELSPTRADFISLLFSKPRPSGLDTTTSIAQMWDAYWPVPFDAVALSTNLDRIVNHLVKTRAFRISPEDVESLRYVYRAFVAGGPIISYSGVSANGSNFATLTRATDAAGTPRSFLATEENFRFIKGMHQKNLIIPVVADFAGPSGIRSVAKYLHDHNVKVTAFYVSNVESYLFRNGVSSQFYANVATLPLDSNSVFIRPGGNTPIILIDGRAVSGGMAAGRETSAPNAAICPIQAFLAAHAVVPFTAFRQASECRT